MILVFQVSMFNREASKIAEVRQLLLHSIIPYVINTRPAIPVFEVNTLQCI